MKKTWLMLLIATCLVVVALIVFILRSRTDTQLAGRNKITVQLQWTAGAQFIGF